MAASQVLSLARTYAFPHRERSTGVVISMIEFSLPTQRHRQGSTASIIVSQHAAYSEAARS
eukprot:1939320-Amphidinium_carterae.2